MSKKKDADSTILHLSPNNLSIHPKNMRRVYPEHEVQAMLSSIKATGRVIHALRIVKNGMPGHFYVVDGNIRLQAAKLLVKESPDLKLKCELVDDTEAEQLLNMLVTSKFRFSPNPIDEARHYQRMMHEQGYTVEGIVNATGLASVTIENRLLLLTLDIAIQELVAKKELPSDHKVTKALLAIPDPKARVKMAERMAGQGASIKAIVSSCGKLTEKLREAADMSTANDAATKDAAGKKVTPASVVAAGASDDGRKVKEDTKAPWGAIRAAAREQCEACCQRPAALSKVSEPAWSIISHAAHETCCGCSIRAISSACAECPIIEMLKKLISAIGVRDVHCGN